MRDQKRNGAVALGTARGGGIAQGVAELELVRRHEDRGIELLGLQVALVARRVPLPELVHGEADRKEPQIPVQEWQPGRDNGGVPAEAEGKSLGVAAQRGGQRQGSVEPAPHPARLGRAGSGLAGDCASHHDRLAVLCPLEIKILKTLEHGVAHVGQDHPPAAEAIPMAPERPVVKVVFDRLLKKGLLSQKCQGSGSSAQQWEVLTM